MSNDWKNMSRSLRYPQHLKLHLCFSLFFQARSSRTLWHVGEQRRGRCAILQLVKREQLTQRRASRQVGGASGGRVLGAGVRRRANRNLSEK